MADDRVEARPGVPGYAKFLIVVQSIVIVYFVFWSLEEYANNLYFQSYVNSTLQTSGFGLIALGSVGIFSAIAAGLYMKLRRTRLELHRLGTVEETHVEPNVSGSVLDTHVEQHLINMIRKSSDNTVSGSLPVLKREEPSGQTR